jgi:hypothetical protein
MDSQNAQFSNALVDVNAVDCFSCQTESADFRKDVKALGFDNVGLARVNVSRCESCDQVELIALFRADASMPNLPAGLRFIEDMLKLAASDSNRCDGH